MTKSKMWRLILPVIPFPNDPTNDAQWRYKTQQMRARFIQRHGLTEDTFNHIRERYWTLTFNEFSYLLEQKKSKTGAYAHR